MSSIFSDTEDSLSPAEKKWVDQFLDGMEKLIGDPLAPEVMADMARRFMNDFNSKPTATQIDNYIKERRSQRE